MAAGARLEAVYAVAGPELDKALAEGAPPVTAFRDALRLGNERLYACFDEGVPATDLIPARSLLVDAILSRAWELHIPPESHAALVPVGGYGRGELHPSSDLDLLLLLEEFPPSQPNALKDSIEALITFLWDIGMEVGQSVRTLDECVAEASADVTVITNLMEGRLLAGNSALFEAMREATDKDHIWNSADFFSAKIQEQKRRWHKYGDTAYKLEPNIKENPGGLRDIQMIGWVAKRHFAAETLHDLVTHGFLTEGEHLSLRDGQALLWRVRFQLHRLTGRREDRLLFDHQRTLAADFGFVDDDDGNLAVEQFMQQYYRTVMELNRLNEMLLQLFQEAILLRDRLGPPAEINNRFQSRSSFLEVSSPDTFRRNPIALLEVFHILQTHPEIIGVRASTIRSIRENRHQIDDRVRADLGARSLFMEIMRHPGGLGDILMRMNRYGVLAAYIPVFANIVGRMQYDLFHVYTVDEHTLRVLRNLCRFSERKHRNDSPLCAGIAHSIPKLELLYLAGLFHDIAKGRGGNHSLIGARDAWDFCQLHELSEYDSRLVSWLVENHLLLSTTAQHADLSDTLVIQAFAERMGDPTRLDYLYLLTVADMRATNPGRWNAWKDSLLRELYHNTRRALLRGLHNPQAQDELIQAKQSEAMRLASAYGIAPKDSKALWLKFNLDYFLHNSPDEIAWQTRLVLQSPPDALPLVAIRPVTARGGTEIFIYTHDRGHLFSQTTALLDQHGLSIVDARIITTDEGMALSAYHVLNREGGPLEDDVRRGELREALKVILGNSPNENIQVARRLPRQLKCFPTATKVSFTPDERNQRTLMRLTTLDRPGLLAEVGAVFEECDVRLRNAKVVTIGAEVEDIFYITQDETAVTSEVALSCLRREIHRRLESDKTASANLTQ